MSGTPASAVRRSLRWRLLTWTVGVTVVILAAVIGWNYLTMRERLEAEARERAAALAGSSAARIDARLAVLKGLAEGIAATLETQGLQLTFSQLWALQTAVVEQRPDIYGIAVAVLPEFAPQGWPSPAFNAYRDNDLVAYSNLAGDRRPYQGEDWFFLAQYLGRPVWSEPYVGYGTKMTSYSVPIRIRSAAGPQFAGVVTCDIALDWLDRAIAELPLGEHGYGVLLSRNGSFVAGPLKERILNETVFSFAEEMGNDELRRVGKRILAGEPGLTPWLSWGDGEESWLAWHPLHTADWSMVTFVSMAPLKAEIFTYSRNLALVGSGGLVLLVLAVWLIARSITQPVQQLSAAAATLAAGELSAPLPAPRGQDEVAQLTVAFSTMRDNLRAYIADLAETTAIRERMNGELQVARTIQMELVPKTFPAYPERDDLDLFALMVPAREVGGDFYDFFFLDDGRLAVAIGDVSGKGVPASLFMAVTRSFLRAELKKEGDPGKVLGRVNNELAEGNESCMFVTLFCAVIDIAGGMVNYANAGHNPPLLVAGDGARRWVGSPSGPAAGAMEGMTYRTGELRLAVGESLLLYTDGVTEAMDPQNCQYGDGRLAEIMGLHATADCCTALQSLHADIGRHAAEAEQSDDITLLMVRRLAPNGGERRQETPPC